MFHFTFKYVTPCSEVLFAIGQPYGFILCKNCISGLKNMNIIYKLLVASILKRYRTFTCTATNFWIFFYFLFSTLYIHISNKHKKYLDNKFLISKMVSLYFFIYLSFDLCLVTHEWINHEKWKWQCNYLSWATAFYTIETFQLKLSNLKCLWDTNTKEETVLLHYLFKFNNNA
jgi:hypothetical protein